jgi:CRP-like cAMP-binding protein
MMDKELKKLLSHPLFEDLELQLLGEVFSGEDVQVPAFGAGDVIFSPASSTHVAGILLEGKAEVLTPDVSHPTLLRYLSDGDLFGITNLFSGEAFVSVIRAKTATTVCFFSDRTVRELMARDDGFLEKYLAFLSGRIRFLNRKISYLTAGSAERRLALYLTSYDREEIRLSDSISSLSELLGVGRASLYRAFERLGADGYLEKKGRTLRLPDREALRKAYQ